MNTYGRSGHMSQSEELPGPSANDQVLVRHDTSSLRWYTTSRNGPGDCENL